MDPNPKPALLILLLTLTSADPSSLLSELRALRSNSDSGVIHLTDESITRFLTSVPTPRPYSLLIFFDAASFRSKPDLHLPKLRSEFSLLSLSYQTHHPPVSEPANPIFFADIDYDESQTSFSLFSVSSLPHVRLVTPATLALEDSVPMDQSSFSGLADSMADFVESNTNIPVGPIVRPPPISRKQIAFLLIALLIMTPYLIQRVLSGETEDKLFPITD